MGAVLDGPIQYDTGGKLAAMRSPDGLMVSLRELSSSSASPAAR